MSEELDVLKMVTGRLDAAGIPYMVTGSMALNYYAVPRMTRDVDVVAELGIADVNRVAELFGIRSRGARASTSSRRPSW
ncbi:MAG: hypothetical protein DMD81_13195 [Candidatus Rokuibacteriota bacterium]|nr:MAG: hypothetical protein DMD81_13195 [Candidatus Rokubacteria bacterium]